MLDMRSAYTHTHLWVKRMTRFWLLPVLLKLQSVTFQWLVVYKAVKVNLIRCYSLGCTSWYVHTVTRGRWNRKQFIPRCDKCLHSHAGFNWVKDIHDLYRVYGDWRCRAAVTLVVHDDHEEIAARNLLYYKRSARHGEMRRWEAGHSNDTDFWLDLIRIWYGICSEKMINSRTMAGEMGCRFECFYAALWLLLFRSSST